MGWESSESHCANIKYDARLIQDLRGAFPGLEFSDNTYSPVNRERISDSLNDLV